MIYICHGRVELKLRKLKTESHLFLNLSFYKNAQIANFVYRGKTLHVLIFIVLF